MATKRQQFQTSSIYATCRTNYTDSNGESVVNIRTSIDGKKITLDTGIRIKPDDWDKNKKTIKKSGNNSHELSMIIERCKAKVNDIFIEYHLAEKVLTPADVKREYYNKESKKNFISWAQLEIKERRNEAVDAETLKMHTCIINKLSVFCKGVLPVSELNTMFILRYEKYLRDEKGNSINTINKDFRAIRSYLNRAVKKQIIKKNPFDEYHIKKDVKIPVCLSELELEKIFKTFWIGSENIDERNILRAFLFSCVTGLRKSDVQKIKYLHTKNNIVVMPIYKTRNTRPLTIRIPLTKTALKLIDDSPGTADGYIFPFPSDVSRNLKRAIMRCGVSKNVNYHMSRHTFATIYLRKNKKDFVTLKNLLGHSRIEQTMVYLSVDDEWLIEGMSNFSEFLT